MLKPSFLTALLMERGALRSSELEAQGFSRKAIAEAVRAGEIERIGRGLYIHPQADLSEHQSLIHTVKAVPNARICLFSALRFHDLTTQNPHEVWIAIGRKDRKPGLTYPKLRVQRFSGLAYTVGLEKHSIKGVEIPVYSVAKTVVDLFRYRNKLGIDAALEALREAWREKRFTLDEINKIAAQCGVKNVMRPYLESLVA